MVSAQQVYNTAVLSLPASERLRLATLILSELTSSSAAVLDFADQWSEEDIQDLANFSARYAEESLDKE